MTNSTDFLITVARALGDETRVRILLALRGRELCVCQLVEWIGLAPSTVSKHLSLLRAAKLVESRKEGRWIFYRRAQGTAGDSSVRGALEWVDRASRRDPRTRHDAAALEKVLRIPPEELCRIARS